MPDLDFSELLEYLVKTKDTVENKSTSEKQGSVECIPDNKDNFIESKSRISRSNGFDNLKFKTLIRNNQIKKFKDRQEYERAYTSVTELLNCVRYNYYYRSKGSIDYKKNFNFVYLDFYAGLGTEVHELVQNIYDFKEIKKALFSKIYNVKGEADAITPPYLYEFKTVDEKALFGLDYRVKDYEQGNIYAHILNSEYDYKLNTITLVYFFRDNLKKDPYAIDIKYDSELAKSFLERSNILLDHLSSKKLPLMIGASKDNCKYCIYKENCKTDNKKTDNKTKQEKENKTIKTNSSFKI